ncbi:MAG TPA: hypothetical protein VE981_06685 [Planctomycetota bacterium]|nr:hypothetical protein [Planctomycetota bacterium]
MNVRLIALAALLLVGVACDRKPDRKPAPKPADTPSILVVEPVRASSPTDASLFDLPKEKLYVINGTWRSRSDARKGEYDRPGEFSFERADEKDVDPKEVAEHINRWIERAAIRIIERRDSPPGAEKIERSIDYVTERTTGKLSYVIDSAVPAKKLSVVFDIRERRR